MLFDIGGGEEQCWRVTFDQVARVEEFLGRVFGEMEKLRKSEKVRGGSTLVGRKGRKEAGAGRCRQWRLAGGGLFATSASLQPPSFGTASDSWRAGSNLLTSTKAV
jgi:hypothetical protein